jgi:hypothetical protein
MLNSVVTDQASNFVRFFKQTANMNEEDNVEIIK